VAQKVQLGEAAELQEHYVTLLVPGGGTRTLVQTEIVGLCYFRHLNSKGWNQKCSLGGDELPPPQGGRVQGVTKYFQIKSDFRRSKKIFKLPRQVRGLSVN
jgi:hypothetical protein